MAGIAGIDITGGTILAAFLVFALGFVYLVILNKKFPRVTFLTFEGNIVEFRTRRLDGEKIVPDNIIDILLNKNKLIGENINDFSYGYMGNKKVYLAGYANGTLLPMRLKQADLRLDELGTAKEIAIRYVNTVESTKEQIEKTNPVLLSIISALPISIFIIIFGVMVYMLIQAYDTNMKAMTQSVDAVLAKANTLLEKVAQTQKDSYNAPPSYQNPNPSPVAPQLPQNISGIPHPT